MVASISACASAGQLASSHCSRCGSGAYHGTAGDAGADVADHVVGLHRQLLRQAAHEIDAASADENQHDLVAALRDPVIQRGALFAAAAEEGAVEIGGEDGLRQRVAARLTHSPGPRAARPGASPSAPIRGGRRRGAVSAPPAAPCPARIRAAGGAGPARRGALLQHVAHGGGHVQAQSVLALEDFDRYRADRAFGKLIDLAVPCRHRAARAACPGGCCATARTRR
jgi:hypothetical protein